MFYILVLFQFNVDCLTSLCANHFAENLQLDTVARIYQCADKLEIAYLQDKCVSFIASNFDEVAFTTNWRKIFGKNADDQLAKVYFTIARWMNVKQKICFKIFRRF